MVASFNAANVWMMRILAKCYAAAAGGEGNSTVARELTETADALAAQVQTLYIAGQGVWIAKYPNGSSNMIRHVIDFAYVSEFMHSDLSQEQSAEMVSFVEAELLVPHWMRAQSLKDPFANFSDRTDHGPYGAYDGWPTLVGGSW